MSPLDTRTRTSSPWISPDTVWEEPAPPRPSRGRRKTARRPKRTAAEGPPILSRYPLQSPAARASSRRKRRRTRRRSRVPNIRLRLSLPPRWAAWTWFAVLLAALGVLLWHPALQVTDIQVQGLHWLDPHEVAALPALQGWKGRPLVAVQPQQVAEVVQAAWPALAQVRVEVAWPGILLIHAQERQPVLVWRMGRQTWWVDAHGVAFAPLGDADPDWPVVEVQTVPGAEPPSTPTADQVAVMLALRERLGEDAPLVYHPLYGMGWRAPQGWQVFVGHGTSGLDVRLAVYDALARTLARQDLYPVWMDLSAWQTPTLHFDDHAMR